MNPKNSFNVIPRLALLRPALTLADTQRHTPELQNHTYEPYFYVYTLLVHTHLESEERESSNDDGKRHVDRVVLAPGDGARRHGEQVQEPQRLYAPVHQSRRPPEALRQLPGYVKRYDGTAGRWLTYACC